MGNTENFQSETTWVDPVSMDYHLKQWAEPKRSTIAFNDFFKREISSSKHILDIGAGAGAATYYLSQHHPQVSFKGIDFSPELINAAKLATSKAKTSANQISFEVGNWLKLKTPEVDFDGVISLQTIMCMPELKAPMEQIFTKIYPKWIGMSGYFFEGDISLKTEVFEHVKDRKVFLNTYSIKELQRIAKKHGYEVTKTQPFEIDIDLAKPSNIDIMGTYTKKVIGDKKEEERLQISGPLLLNWYFVLVQKL
jgi:SAM-dependent methyltransferase